MTRIRSRKVDRVLFRLLVAATYPLFLVGTVLARTLPLPGLAAGTTDSPSIFTQALRTGEATIAIAFMG